MSLQFRDFELFSYLCKLNLQLREILHEGKRNLIMQVLGILVSDWVCFVSWTCVAFGLMSIISNNGKCDPLSQHLHNSHLPTTIYFKTRLWLQFVIFFALSWQSECLRLQRCYFFTWPWYISCHSWLEYTFYLCLKSNLEFELLSIVSMKLYQETSVKKNYFKNNTCY